MLYIIHATRYFSLPPSLPPLSLPVHHHVCSLARPLPTTPRGAAGPRPLHRGATASSADSAVALGPGQVCAGEGAAGNAANHTGQVFQGRYTPSAVEKCFQATGISYTGHFIKGQKKPEIFFSFLQLESMIEQLYGPDVNFVDWRRFLVCLALPWPHPSPQDLLEAWQALVPHQQRETVGKKVLSKQAFMGVEIWLDRPAEYIEEPQEPQFNRNRALKDVCVYVYNNTVCSNYVYTKQQPSLGQAFWSL